MAHFDPHQHGSTNIFYWAVWTVIFIASKILGMVSTIASALPPEIKIPHHDIWWLPQLHELIPALILAGGAAFVSFVVNKVCKAIYNKLFPTKE